MARILVIDGDDILRTLLSVTLSLEGHDVLDAENGAVALEVIAKHDIDLVITELMMPVMDGVKFLRELFQTVQSPPQCIVLSSSNLGSAEAEILARGPIKVLRKPIEGSELVGEIRRLLRYQIRQSV